MHAEFFDSLYQQTEGWLELRALPSKARVFVEPASFLDIHAFCTKHQVENCYFAVATRDHNGGKKGNIVHVPAVWTDVDYKDTPREKLKKLFANFPFRPSVIVTTGGGVHFYWILDEPAEQGQIPQVEDVNRRVASALGGDPNSVDAARILRIPGTLNHKYEPARPVELKQLNDFRYELADFDTLPEVEHHQPASNGEDFQGLKHVLFRCSFLCWCRDNPGEVSEPLWYAMLSNVAGVRPGGITLCHELSKPYQGYSYEETTEKILHALDSSRPHSCQWIRENGYKCKKRCGVNLPAGLVFDAECCGQEDWEHDQRIRVHLI